MPTKTIYLAQTFYWVNGRLEPGRAIQFMRAADAKAAGASLADSAPGVAVYSLDGDPAADLWGDAEVIARYGDAPAEAA